LQIKSSTKAIINVLAAAIVAIAVPERCSRKRPEEYDVETKLTKYDLWCSIMPRTDNRRMILILERGRSKIDQSDIGIP